jgi:hypothetical protein
MQYGTYKGGHTMTKTFSNQQKISIALGIAVLLTGFYVLGRLSHQNSTPVAQSTNQTQATVPAANNPDAAAVATHIQTQEEQLLYLIEEEKLAHDVYTVMNQTYGAQVFGNILSSEQNHQSQVLTLLQARNIADPRSSEIGVFKNTELQTLYDQLISQGKQSASEAYKVGVAIEEKDIADITKQLATATDSDIVTTLERLRTGSENHLRAFNRQLSRY